MNDNEQIPVPVTVSEPITVNIRRKKRWPIALGALLGALLPAAVELGILGPQLAEQARAVCLALGPQPLK